MDGLYNIIEKRTRRGRSHDFAIIIIIKKSRYSKGVRSFYIYIYINVKIGGRMTFMTSQ